MLETENTSLLQSQYLYELEKAKLDVETHGDYTREGLACLKNAVEIQIKLAALTKGSVSAHHKQAADELAKQIVANMRRLGMLPPPETKQPAPASAPQQSAAAKAQPAAAKPGTAKAQPAADKAQSDNGELQGFDIEDFIIKPGSVRIEEAENASPDVVAALKSAVYDNFKELFPNLNYNPKASVQHRLLYGPPGTGKTFLCKGLATYVDEIYPNDETNPKNSAFFLAPASAIKSKFVGIAEQRIRSIFEAAAGYSFSVICIDEVDELCSPRSNENQKANYTTTLLELIDGVAGKTKSMILLATNHPEKVDSALISRVMHVNFLDYPAVPALVDYLKNAEEILSGLGETDEQREDMIRMLAETAHKRHFSFRNMQALTQNIEFALRKKLKSVHPEGSSEVKEFIPLTKEALEKIVNSISIDFNQREYDMLRDYYESHGG